MGTANLQTHRFSPGRSLRFNRESRFLPLFPAAFESIYVLIAATNGLLCHTGTCSFIRSGAIEDQRLIFRNAVNPFFYIARILPHGSLDFGLAIVPIFWLPHVDDDDPRIAQHAFYFVLVYSRSFGGTGSYGGNGDDQTAYDCREIEEGPVYHLNHPVHPVIRDHTTVSLFEQRNASFLPGGQAEWGGGNREQEGLSVGSSMPAEQVVEVAIAKILILTGCSSNSVRKNYSCLHHNKNGADFFQPRFMSFIHSLSAGTVLLFTGYSIFCQSLR